MPQLQFHIWAEETEALLEEARQAIAQSQSDSVRELADRLPDLSADQDVPISLALAGQYSAGKSTILQALTGRSDIATGAGIVTAETRFFDWNGVSIIDTPGIHTDIRPEHDEITYDAISNADLMMFVITNELFDSYVSHHYRKLTVDRSKGHETILVVNKMARHAAGNAPESRKRLTEDLRPALCPFTPEQLRITFVDALSALDAKAEEHAESAAYLEQVGNLQALIDNIDAFVHEKGLHARHTTALYAIDQVLQTAIQREPTEDPNADAMALVYNRTIRHLDDAKTTLQGAVELAISHTKSSFVEAGTRWAEQIDRKGQDYDFEATSQTAESKVQEDLESKLQEDLDELSKSIEKALGKSLPDLAEDINATLNGKLFSQTKENLSAALDKKELSPSSEAAWKGVELLSLIASRFALSPDAAGQSATGLDRLYRSPAFAKVLEMGKSLGIRFQKRPGVRIPSVAGYAVLVLQLAGVVITAFEEARRNADAEKMQQEVLDAFDELAEQVGREAQEKAEEIINELVAKPLQEFTEARLQLNQLRQEKSAQLKRLNAVSARVNALIRHIHAER